MKVTWAIQTNLLNHDQQLSVWNAAKDCGCSVQEIVVIPFSEEFGNEIPDIGTLVIPYGSTSMIKLAQKRNWVGNFFDPQTFRAEVWNQNRDDMLNVDCIFTTVGKVHNILNDVAEDEMRFIRPVKDLKEFNGTVTTVKEIKNWMDSVYSGNFSFSEDTEIVIAPIKDIKVEARYFVVGGKVVDGSVYKINNKLSLHHLPVDKIDPEIHEMAKKWLPSECCVMDVALLDNGDLKVVEFNTINGSGFYKHDINLIVKAMSEFVLSKSMIQ